MSTRAHDGVGGMQGHRRELQRRRRRVLGGRSGGQAAERDRVPVGDVQPRALDLGDVREPRGVVPGGARRRRHTRERRVDQHRHHRQTRGDPRRRPGSGGQHVLAVGEPRRAEGVPDDERDPAVAYVSRTNNAGNDFIFTSANVAAACASAVTAPLIGDDDITAFDVPAGKTLSLSIKSTITVNGAARRQMGWLPDDGLRDRGRVRRGVRGGRDIDFVEEHRHGHPAGLPVHGPGVAVPCPGRLQRDSVAHLGSRSLAARRARVLSQATASDRLFERAAASRPVRIRGARYRTGTTLCAALNSSSAFRYSPTWK